MVLLQRFKSSALFEEALARNLNHMKLIQQLLYVDEMLTPLAFSSNVTNWPINNTLQQPGHRTIFSLDRKELIPN